MKPFQRFARPFQILVFAIAFQFSLRADITVLPTAGPQARVKKICIAHRGASAYAPEHTMASYRLALEMKADFVEQDLGVTKDGVLVCLHDMTLERTTNVAIVFPTRSYNPDPTGQNKKTWRLVDFTLEEVKRLDAGSTMDSSFSAEKIPTFQEAIDLVKGRAGIYPELKDADFYARQGFKMEEELLKILKANGLDTKESQATTPVFIQSFSPAALEKVHELAGDTYPLILLIGGPNGPNMIKDVGLAQVVKYAAGIGPDLKLLDPGRVMAAKSLGLAIHPYTVRTNNIPPDYPDAQAYMKYLLYDLGVDGLFTDNPDLFPR